MASFDLRRLFEAWRSPEPPTSAAGAAVLILLRPRPPEVDTLLIVRADDPNDRASGQVGLPGGHVQLEDSTLGETALREAQEEVGIQACDLGSPPHFVELRAARNFGLTVAVFAASLAPQAREPSVANPREVSRIFWLPVSSLKNVSSAVRTTDVGRIPVEAVLYDGEVVWGFTLRVLRNFFFGPTGTPTN